MHLGRAVARRKLLSVQNVMDVLVAALRRLQQLLLPFLFGLLREADLVGLSDFTYDEPIPCGTFKFLPGTK